MNPDNEDIRRYLTTLREPEIPDTAWPRIRRRVLAAQGATARWKPPTRLALAASLIVFAVLLAVLAPSPDPAPSPGDQSPPPFVATAAMPSPAAEQIRAIDRQLQAAYGRQAGEAELVPLWQTRQALLAGQERRPRAKPVRI